MGINARIQLRDALDSDAEALEQLLVDAYGEYASVMPEGSWEPYRQALVGSIRGGSPIARIVAQDQEELLGSVLLYRSSEHAYGTPDLGIQDPVIRYLAVSPRARGLGIASLLVAEAARRARSIGAETLYLHSSDLMASAIRLYERLGFERDLALISNTPPYL